MTYEEYLMHYGIPGMKWGQKNGPPYPLGASQYSYKERKERARAYNKELRGVQSSREYKKSDKMISKAREKYDREISKILAKHTVAGSNIDKLYEQIRTGKDENGKTLSEKQILKLKNEFNSNVFKRLESNDEAVKVKESMKNWQKENKKYVDIYNAGNKKVLEILDRAESEGGFDLKTVPGTTINIGKSLAANILMYGALNAVTIPSTGFMIYPIIPYMVPGTEHTDRYYLKAKKD